MCYFLLFPWLLKKPSHLPNLELDSPLSRFYGSVWTKKSMNGVYKANIDCSFIRGMAENNCNLSLLFTSALRACPRWIVAKVEFHLGDNNFPPFPSWVVNICILFASVVLCHNPLLPGLQDHDIHSTCLGSRSDNTKPMEHWCIVTVAWSIMT